MELKSLRAVFNCDDFPPAWICIGKRRRCGREEQNRNQDPSSEPNPEKRRVVSLSLFLSCSIPRVYLRQRAATWRIRTGGLRNICSLNARLQHSQSDPTERNGKESKRKGGGRESLVRTRRTRRKKRGEKTRRGGCERVRPGRWRLVNERPARLSSNPSRKQSRILTLIYRSLPQRFTPLITVPVSQPPQPGSRSHTPARINPLSLVS